MSVAERHLNHLVYIYVAEMKSHTKYLINTSGVEEELSVDMLALRQH